MNKQSSGHPENKGTVDSLSQERATASNAIEIPQIALPKGGGALKGIDEKFQVNPSNGTASFSIPLPLSPNRNAFTPQLNLSYNSGTGNSSFGIGWDIDLPAVQRRTDKKLPRYLDTNDTAKVDTEDSFMFSGVEELVPLMDWKNNEWKIRQETTIDGFTVRAYRPRIEGGFARIERIHHVDHGYYWRVTSKDNIITFFGFSKQCRIADPIDESLVFQWLPEFSYDDKGSWVWYEYKAEDLKQVANELNEKNRFNGNQPFTNQHLKRIRYGNQDAYYTTSIYAIDFPGSSTPFFDLIFDYGEHDPSIPKTDDHLNWSARKDPFSVCRPGFEIRTYRLCRRVLMYHTFPELNAGMPSLVRSLDFDYAPSTEQLNQSDRPTELTYLVGITQKGYVWHNNQYYSKALPKMSFDYQWLHWDTAVKYLGPESVMNIPTGLSGNYQWVDLYNEGINGILTEQANGWYYKANGGVNENGELMFGKSQVVMPKPSFSGIGNGVLQLQDLEANGQKQLVVNSGGTQGFWELNESNEWQPFQAFLKTHNLDLRDPNVRMLDVNGDGKPEIVFSDAGAFWYWQNEGKSGYDSPELATKPFDEEKGAAILFSDQEQRIFLADMSGDGLTDLVRIRNGEVCYWQNLGYGRFSAKISMANAPVFDCSEQFNPNYLQLTDISGTGATDLLYLGKNKFKAYLNFSGNAWSGATEIDPFFSTEQPNKITVTDLLGNGTACIVWSSELPAHQQIPMRYMDLMGGKKPHIMRSHENGMGKRTDMEYKSSTSYYLQDKKKGFPWITKLAFPVQVVSKTIITESVTNVRFSSQYSYHHGYYDHAEREFRGFGRVEQTDTEDFDFFEQTNAGNVVPEAHHQPPVLTKTWFHTGAFIDRERILTQFKKEYWYEVMQRNGYASNTVEYPLPDAVLLAAENIAGFQMDQLSAGEWREALRACKGMTLRQEVFGLDAQKRIADEKQAKNYLDTDEAFINFKANAHQTEQIPYSVATHNCEVLLLQERARNKYASFVVKESEAISYAYERNTTDPRIAHTLTLATDELGNVLESVSVVYPRMQEEALLKDAATDTNASRQAKKKAREAQQKQWISFTKNSFSNDIINPSQYYLRKNWQTQTYELTGLKPDHNRAIYAIADFKDKIAAIAEIEYQQTANGMFAQKRLIEHIKTKFYNEQLTMPLADGFMAPRCIPYEAYQLAYTPNLLNDIFTPTAFAAPFEITDAAMLAAKYLQDNTNWWVQSGTLVYHLEGESFTAIQQRFFAPVGYIDAFDSETQVAYDARHLFLQKAMAIVDKVKGISNDAQVLQFNYRTLSASIMKDINDNISAAVADELGLVKATAIEGKAKLNALQGEEADNLVGHTEWTDSAESTLLQSFFDLANTPAGQVCDSTQLQNIAKQLLGSASARLVYDFSKQPSVVASIVREQHSKQNANSPVQISFEYTDGLGKVAMKKVQAEAGKVKLPNGTEKDTGTQLRWVGNGRTVLNNKGKPIKQFEPYFSTTPAYEDDPAWVEQGVSPILYYDGAGRNIKTELPNGTFTKVVFDAWKQLSYDANDTVTDSTWYAQRKNLADSNPEKKAALKTVVHYNTPSCIIMDTLGRPILGIDHNRWEDSDGNTKEEFYFTCSDIDIEGNAQSITDARGNRVMNWRYNMLGHRVAQSSMDAGKRWMLNDANGKPIKSWDERQHEFSFEYDALHRPTKKLVKGGDGPAPLNHCYESIIYGEGIAGAKTNNLKGQAAIVYDTAGKIIHEHVDFKGNVLSTVRVFAMDYKNTPNWAIADPDSLLESSGYTFKHKASFDALNRPTTQTTPDGKITKHLFNAAGLLEKVLLQEGITDTTYVDNIAYDAKGQRDRIQYGNGVFTKYSYDPLTFRLTGLKSSTSGTELLQDLAYTYDPSGNISQVQDSAIPTLFFKNQKIAGKNEYSYDALYRLISATGREQNTNAPNFGTEDNWNDAYAIFSQNSGDPMAMRNYTQRYLYDAVGNILQIKHTAGDNGSWTRDTSYETKNNRLKSSSIGSNTYNFFHHAQHGYLKALPHLSSMVWTFKEELLATAKQVTNTDTPETTYYVYDGTGQRARKITENQAAEGTDPDVKNERIYVGAYEWYGNSDDLERETLHLMDDQSRIAMLDTETAARTFLGIPLGRTSPVQTVRYQVSNHLGSVSLELDEHAATISYEEYHPYGTTAYQARNAAIDAAAKRYRYTGMERDEETGLAYHTARYYMPWLGRWCSADPIGIEGGGNFYEYCDGDPINKNDKEGKAGSDPKFDYQLKGINDLYAKRMKDSASYVKFINAVDKLVEDINKVSGRATHVELNKDLFFDYMKWKGMALDTDKTTFEKGCIGITAVTTRTFNGAELAKNAQYKTYEDAAAQKNKNPKSYEYSIHFQDTQLWKSKIAPQKTSLEAFLRGLPKDVAIEILRKAALNRDANPNNDEKFTDREKDILRVDNAITLLGKPDPTPDYIDNGTKVDITGWEQDEGNSIRVNFDFGLFIRKNAILHANHAETGDPSNPMKVYISNKANWEKQVPVGSSAPGIPTVDGCDSKDPCRGYPDFNREVYGVINK